MEIVIVLLNVTTKEPLFVSRHFTFNNAFASKVPGELDYCILQHEATDIASAFMQLICEFNEEHILPWAVN